MSEATEESTRIAALIRRLISRIYVSSKAMHKRFGLTGPQTLVLRTLLGQEYVSLAALADVIYVTPSNLTGIIDRLESKGFVERVRGERDRRMTFVAITEEGVRQAKDLPDPIEQRVAAGLTGCRPESVETLIASLELLVGFMEAAEPAAQVEPDSAEFEQ
jgi:DNA-binding MarR family transcriptional regulator